MAGGLKMDRFGDEYILTSIRAVLKGSFIKGKRSVIEKWKPGSRFSAGF